MRITFTCVLLYCSTLLCSGMIIQLRSSITSSRRSPLYITKYTQFTDYRAIDPKMKEFQNREVLDIETILDEESSSTYKSGADLRKERNRDLKSVQRDQQLQVKSRVLGKTTKKSTDDISSIVSCLNESFTVDDQSSLSPEEHINWDRFDAIAASSIGNYSAVNKNITTRNWIKFHMRKGDIVFRNGSWLWVKVIRWLHQLTAIVN